MGLADEIRAKQEAVKSQAEKADAAAVANYDKICRLLDVVVPRYATALKELGVKPEEKAGWRTSGWVFGFKAADPPPTGEYGLHYTVLVLTDGHWKWWQVSRNHSAKSYVVTDVQMRRRWSKDFGGSSSFRLSIDHDQLEQAFRSQLERKGGV